MELETAKKLVELAGDRHIPVRCNIRSISGKGGGGGHFSRGSLVGIEGNRLKVKPYKHGGKIEICDCDVVHVWTSRCVSNGVLTQEQIDNAHEQSIMNKPFPQVIKTIEKKITLESAICDVADSISDKQGLPLSDNIDRFIDIIDTSVKKEIMDNKTTEVILEKKILSASNATSFVIADYNSSDSNNLSIRFYMGKGSRRFTSGVEDAVVFSGDHAETNAKRSLGQIYHRPQMWKGVISSPKNLKVITLEEAQDICDRILLQKKNKIQTETKSPQTLFTSAATVKENPQPEKPDETVKEVSEPVAQVTATPDKILVDTSAKQDEVSKQNMFADPAIQTALGEIQASMVNVQTAVDMLKEERHRLLKAQETLIHKVSHLVSGQLKIIDHAVVEGTSALTGKQS